MATHNAVHQGKWLANVEHGSAALWDGWARILGLEGDSAVTVNACNAMAAYPNLIAPLYWMTTLKKKQHLLLLSHFVLIYFIPTKKICMSKFYSLSQTFGNRLVNSVRMNCCNSSGNNTVETFKQVVTAVCIEFDWAFWCIERPSTAPQYI